MAEVLLKEKLARAGLLQDWRVESSGTWGEEGMPATSGAIEAAAARELDLEGHRSRGVTADYLREFDLILTMEPGHREALAYEFADVADRVHLLSEMAGHSFSIADPVGQPVEVYHATMDEIEDLLERGFDRIREEAQSR
jgi:protein-tyrosine-phosphatase